jgi:hypothetical protein
MVESWCVCARGARVAVTEWANETDLIEICDNIFCHLNDFLIRP